MVTSPDRGADSEMQEGVPIVPISIVGSRAVLPHDSMIFRAGPMTIFAGPPIPNGGMTDADLPAMVRQVRGAMLSHFPDE